MPQLENKDNVRALLKSPVTSIRHRHETSLRIDYLVVLYQSSRGGRHWSWHDRFHMHSRPRPTFPVRVAEKHIMHVLFSRNFIHKSNRMFLNK